ncbi:nitroreductase family protein [Martelella mediterranea]|uniref:Putative NAD(P)H nitroreductase n=1 Tax=Martelella mediterranea DSM 17316 TaxID=1122214 RepID=A0A1U9Z531_9HYPH|nr:nitroreductase [Martelella mediterranea]AQZ52774.1 Putative NAD(P)H nitroreductase YdjA [Martelella mediterranea DSM 17316]
MTAKNDTLIDFLKTRRSTPVLQLAAPGPDRGEIAEMLTIASRVPDHGKLAPWRFIVFAGAAREEAGEKLAEIVKADDPEASPERLKLERERLTRAPLVIAVVSRAAVHPKIPEWEQVMSAGAVCYNLVVAANAFGYGATWLTEWYAFDERAKPALGLEADEKIAGFIHIGTRTEAPFERVRPALDDIVTWRGEA